MLINIFRIKPNINSVAIDYSFVPTSKTTSDCSKNDLIDIFGGSSHALSLDKVYLETEDRKWQWQGSEGLKEGNSSQSSKNCQQTIELFIEFIIYQK